MQKAMQPSSHQTPSRWDGLDALKCLCAFMVILLHRAEGPAIDAYAVPISRMAVPVFFMITGFFFELRWPDVRLAHQLRKTLHMLIIGVLLYTFLLWRFCTAIGTTLPAYLQMLTDGRGIGFTIRNTLLYNSSPLPNAEHLWYLCALIYTLLIVHFIRRLLGKTGMNLLYLATPLLILASVVFSNYSTLITGYRFYVFETRNFLLCGIPYFCLGSLICARRTALIRRFSAGVCLLLLLLFSALACLEEHYLIGVRTVNALDFYFSTAFQVFFAFLLFLHLSERNPIALRPLSWIGRYHSGNIYLIHLAVGSYVQSLFSAFGLSAVYRTFCPFIIFLESLLISMLCKAFLQRIAGFISALPSKNK